ncbi:MAG: ATPase, T2SS/T4P/T4SS family [Acidimicrobiaceae bacterium]|nr:ATPase, T2SS/T4P/T4SS family [Acidimicrobiaceae bacterium]
MADANPGLELFQQSHDRLLRRFLELERQNLPADVIDKQLMDLAESIVQDFNTSALIAGKPRLTDGETREFRSQARGIMGGGALVPLLEREDVENIHILGHDKVILSLANGDRIPGPPLAGSEEELVMMIRHLAATAGHTSRRFDTAAPILDLRLASGHRLFAVTAVAERTSIVIRRHRMLQSSLERLAQSGTVTPPMIEVLRAAVRPPNPANMLVVGGTGAGKTTLLRSLLSEVPQSELIVTIEDTLELHLRSSGLHERTLALETRTSNTEGLGEISMYDLCRAALRMSPDRVIVGEVRGGEVMQLLQAMGIGNDGSLGTIHAGSTRAAINKMLIYAQRSPDSPTPDSVLREISEVLHLLVYIKKLPDGRRAVTSIREVVGYEEGRVVTSEVFAPGPDGVGVYTTPFKADGEPLARLVAAGFDPSMLGRPYRPAPVVPQSQPQPQPPPQPRPQPPPQPPPQQPQPQPRPQPQPQQPQPGGVPGGRRPDGPVQAPPRPPAQTPGPRPAGPAPVQPQRHAAPPPPSPARARPAAPGAAPAERAS